MDEAANTRMEEGVMMETSYVSLTVVGEYGTWWSLESARLVKKGVQAQRDSA